MAGLAAGHPTRQYCRKAQPLSHEQMNGANRELEPGAADERGRHAAS
jgi:hypothetical protein